MNTFALVSSVAVKSVEVAVAGTAIRHHHTTLHTVLSAQIDRRMEHITFASLRCVEVVGGRAVVKSGQSVRTRVACATVTAVRLVPFPIDVLIRTLASIQQFVQLFAHKFFIICVRMKIQVCHAKKL